jgi:hypothetical protein
LDVIEMLKKREKEQGVIKKEWKFL